MLINRAFFLPRVPLTRFLQFGVVSRLSRAFLFQRKTLNNFPRLENFSCFLFSANMKWSLISLFYTFLSFRQDICLVVVGIITIIIPRIKSTNTLPGLCKRQVWRSVLPPNHLIPASRQSCRDCNCRSQLWL